MDGTKPHTRPNGDPNTTTSCDSPKLYPDNEFAVYRRLPGSGASVLHLAESCIFSRPPVASVVYVPPDASSQKDKIVRCT